MGRWKTGWTSSWRDGRQVKLVDGVMGGNGWVDGELGDSIDAMIFE